MPHSHIGPTENGTGVHRGAVLTFPEGRHKALVMNYDDGSEHDYRLVELLNTYGLRGTFNLNSSRLGQDHFVKRRDVRGLYDGHEVASHTLTHPDLVQLRDDDIRHELYDDKSALENLAGYPVRGFAYPFGTYDDRVAALVAEAGLAYGRTIHDTFGFSLPTEVLRLTTTCHHSQAFELGQAFLNNLNGGLHFMLVWGHSYEFDGFMTRDPAQDWGYLTAFCRMMQGQRDIWYTTTIDVVDYTAAMAAIQFSDDGAVLTNRSSRDVWAEIDGATVRISPDATIQLRNA
ncbi:MAG: polysaccharide deacetylase family protein [Hyphomicrobiales bacterium]|nr:polysaccharide deacetylase family protein [Hyphomicrobiales bacterium]